MAVAVAAQPRDFLGPAGNTKVARLGGYAGAVTEVPNAREDSASMEVDADGDVSTPVPPKPQRRRAAMFSTLPLDEPKEEEDPSLTDAFVGNVHDLSRLFHEQYNNMSMLFIAVLVILTAVGVFFGGVALVGVVLLKLARWLFKREKAAAAAAAAKEE
jgi:hypothetical protein